MKNLQEIADDLHLARSTVSMCLSADFHRYRLRRETVERVREYARENGYVPNRLARKLSRADSCSAIGLIVFHENGSEKSFHALELTLERLTAEGRDFFIQNVPEHKLSQALLLLKGMQVRDVILFGLLYEVSDRIGKLSPRQKRLQEDHDKAAVLLRGMRLFAIDYSFPVPEKSVFGDHICRMGVDRQTALRDLLNELLRAGKKRIMCDLDTNLLFSSSNQYFPDSRFVFPSGRRDNLYEYGKKCAQYFAVVRNELHPDIAVFHNDRCAIGFIDELRNHGLSVPADVEVIGFNNTEICNYYNPRLTSLRIPVEENAERVLNAILNNTELELIQEQKAKIVWRESATLENKQKISMKF